ncbi:MAG TPA: hypothetical protein VL334_23470, partial [Anaerolineae bacterium]|nr:hypothetical protein [Anaerolineae bacterium]
PVVRAPQVPVGMSGVMLDVTPDAIALTRSDMPAGFQLAAERGLGSEYVALYLRPSALESDASGGNKLLSVLTSVGVYTSTVAAERVYLNASADPTKQAIDDITVGGGAATDVVVEPFAGAAQGAEASEAFRVTYRLMNQAVFEYGHRFRLGNVLGHVVVAAIGDPDEPEHLLRDARDLAQRQIDRIVQAAAQSMPN